MVFVTTLRPLPIRTHLLIRLTADLPGTTKMPWWKIVLIFFGLQWLFGSSSNASNSQSGGSRPQCNDYNHNGICDEEEDNQCHNSYDDDEPVWDSSSWLDDCDNSYGYDDDDD